MYFMMHNFDMIAYADAVSRCADDIYDRLVCSYTELNESISPNLFGTLTLELTLVKWILLKALDWS